MIVLTVIVIVQVEIITIVKVIDAVGADDDEERGRVRAYGHQTGGVVELDLRGADLMVSTLFATTASTETLNGTILGVIVLFVLPSPSQKLHPKS